MPVPPPVTTILLVRHGQTPTTGKVLPGRAAGLHLADAGRAQAALVAERLVGIEIAALYCSPLERTVETAAPIAEAFGLEAPAGGFGVEVPEPPLPGSPAAAPQSARPPSAHRQSPGF